MSVMSGACVSRARLQATDGAPMPTKHTSSFFNTRAAATAIISAVEYSIGLLQTPRLANCSARCLDDSVDCPIWQDCSIRAWNAQVIYNLLHGHEHTGRRERSLLLNPDDPLDQHVP